MVRRGSSVRVRLRAWLRQAVRVVLRAPLRVGGQLIGQRPRRERSAKSREMRRGPSPECHLEANCLTASRVCVLLGAMSSTTIEERRERKLRCLAALLAETGLRVSEALGLDWSDVEFGGVPRLRVRRQFYRGTLKRLKSRNGRRDLPLSAALARRLWTVRPADGAGPVFATRNGTRYLDRNVRRVLDKATERAGLEWVSFHTFRHTCASMLFDSGRNIRQVCDWLGHADPAFTLRTYVHLMDGGLGEPLDLGTELKAVHQPGQVAQEAA